MTKFFFFLNPTAIKPEGGGGKALDVQGVLPLLVVRTQKKDNVCLPSVVRPLKKIYVRLPLLLKYFLYILTEGIKIVEL